MSRNNQQKPININSKEKVVDLMKRKYRIYLLGGWGVNMGKFLIIFKDKETGKLVECKRAFYPVQTFSHGKRAKRILTVEIPKPSSYEVIFTNPKSVRVRSSNLFISSLFTKPILNENIEILITEQFGFFPVIE